METKEDAGFGYIFSDLASIHFSDLESMYYTAIQHYNPFIFLDSGIITFLIGHTLYDPVYEKGSYSLSKYLSLIIHNSWSAKAITGTYLVITPSVSPMLGVD